jgi:hypothetical protein
MKNTKFIYEYWNRTNLGREMIKSNRVSELDLLFLIPNNVKKCMVYHLLAYLAEKSVSKKNKEKDLFYLLNSLIL